MNDLSTMSRSELVCELLAPPAASASDAAAAYAYLGDGDTSASSRCEVLVSHRLSVAREILLRDLKAHMHSGSMLNSPNAVREWLKLRCANVGHEVFMLLHLDVRNRLIEAEAIFRGTLTQTAVYPREVLKSVLKHNAASVILAHNHPSGSVEPSEADRMLTGQLACALSLVEVRVLDHFIVAGDAIFSFAEQGLL
ncbi:DNA repair protein RadC [Herbaspirillum sp. ST 5-3]|uniref:RadC family protein n=1 Tax=Oxalobacteraceae TaxID=75682 RepID=UPI0010A2CE08|nr:DNA repair protein RadC [Herbaspirillum sp. ST 5-3]